MTKSASNKQWEPLTTAEAVIEAIKAGRHVEYTACGCGYQAHGEGWIVPYLGDGHEGAVRKAFWLGGKRRYRALIAPAQPHSCANCLGVDPASCMFAPAQPAADVDPADAELAAAIGKGTEAWAGVPDGWVDELRGGAVEPARAKWQPIETAPKDHMPRLYLCHGKVLQGFEDATGALFVQHELGWRVMRRKPTHWMPLPEPPND